MKKEIIITLPLEVYTTKSKTKKSKFILNLNTYRNCHYTKLNSVKIAYKNAIQELIPGIKLGKVKLTYTYYAKTRRRLDISNVCSIIDKFTCDALVDKGVLIDDNYDYIPEVTYKFGGVDKNNPRCELLIEEI